MKRVLVIGGYGHFGTFICKELSKEPNIHLIIAGRNLNKAKALAESFSRAEAVCLDIHNNFSELLKDVKADIVIHTSGPYQGQDYHVAKACIANNCHYIDLADARDFVSNISQLDRQAKDKNLFICSGASSVPCLTSSVIDYYEKEFTQIEELHYSISTAQRTHLGLATLKSILGYAGKPFETLINGQMKTIYGNMDQGYIDQEKRIVGNCDIPDLDIFPKRYPHLKTIRFKAGTELRIIQYILLFLSWCVKKKLISSLVPLAPLMLKLSSFMNIFGSSTSYFTVKMVSMDQYNKAKTLTFSLKADKGDGLYIPCIPSILLTKKLANNMLKQSGAMPCIGFITLDEYLDTLSQFNISWDAKSH